MIDIGNAQTVGKRDNQEDYLASLEIGNGMLSIVADGMGGYEGGEIASKVCVKSFIEFFKSNFNTIAISELLIQSVNHSNEKLKEAKEINPSLEEMGTTLISVYATNKSLYWVNVGDSLLYRYSNNKIMRLNADHSIAGELQSKVNLGQMTQEVADSQPNRHALTSALTGYDIPHIEQSQIQIDKNDRFIIASDGIHTLNDEQIEHLASRTQDNQILADSLIQLVEKKSLKNQDNTTLIVLESKADNINIQKEFTTGSGKARGKVFFISTIIVLISIIVFLVYENYADIIIKKLDFNVSDDLNSTIIVQTIEVNTSIKESNATQ